MPYQRIFPHNGSNTFYARLYARLFLFLGRPGPGLFPPHYRPKYHPTDQPLIGRPLNAVKKRRILRMVVSTPSNALYATEGVGVRHKVVGELSALDVNGPQAGGRGVRRTCYGRRALLYFGRAVT